MCMFLVRNKNKPTCVPILNFSKTFFSTKGQYINRALHNREVRVTHRRLFQDGVGYTKLRINALDTKIISNIDFLILVPSSPSNIELRDRIRRTWGSAPSTFRHKQVFFFFGRSDNPTLEELLVEENKVYGDVIQAGQSKSNCS